MQTENPLNVGIHFMEVYDVCFELPHFISYIENIVLLKMSNVFLNGSKNTILCMFKKKLWYLTGNIKFLMSDQTEFRMRQTIVTDMFGL